MLKCVRYPLLDAASLRQVFVCFSLSSEADWREVTKHQTSTFQIDCDNSNKTTTKVNNKDQKVTLLKYHQEAREAKSPDPQTTQAWQCTKEVGELSESWQRRKRSESRYQMRIIRWVDTSFPTLGMQRLFILLLRLTTSCQNKIDMHTAAPN